MILLTTVEGLISSDTNLDPIHSDVEEQHFCFKPQEVWRPRYSRDAGNQAVWPVYTWLTGCRACHT